MIIYQGFFQARDLGQYESIVTSANGLRSVLVDVQSEEVKALFQHVRSTSSVDDYRVLELLLIRVCIDIEIEKAIENTKNIFDFLHNLTAAGININEFELNHMINSAICPRKIKNILF